MKLLTSWIGTADLLAAEKSDPADEGPVAAALARRKFDEALLLADQSPARVERFAAWLRARTKTAIRIERVRLSGPTDFGDIHKAATSVLDRYLESASPRPRITFHLSPGTPAMAAIWIILAKTRYGADLIETSREHGLRSVTVPFDLAAELITGAWRGADSRLGDLSEGAAPEAARFGDIIYRSATMHRVVDRARKAALRSVPVLIEGESGTGKELLARAIHAASPRAGKPMLVMNCGAIPSELIESELFGHEKGAFSGAHQAKVGYFESADGGTLFLDEVGELPLAAQVKLLRVLQEQEITRVGATRSRKIDVRIIAATNRNLIAEVANGRFREDLFFRLAVLVLGLPPLRNRSGDLGPLIDGLLGRINVESESEPEYAKRRLSVAARNLLLRHSWPGNVRELQNTLRRAAVWASGPTIEKADIEEALLVIPTASLASEAVMGRPIEAGVDIKGLINQVARHYLAAALTAANGNKSKAAELVGLPNYQTFTNWMHKHGVK